jgi:hypothetical protein
MAAYIAYHEGKLVDQDYDERELAMALAGLPSVAAGVAAARLRLIGAR